MANHQGSRRHSKLIYRYQTQGTCSRLIDVDIGESGVISDIRFEGGCDGNLRGMRALVKGRTAEELIPLLEGIPCSGKSTSCPDQLARALKAILEQEKG